MPSNISLGTSSGKTRTYYIQAQKEDWDFGPGGYHPCTLKNYSIRYAVYNVRTNVTVGPVYKKAFYRQYTDASFSSRTVEPAYHGMMGPLITAEAGDTLVIVLKNTLEFDINLSPSGGLIITGAEDPTEGDAVPPGTTYTYTWHVPDAAGPGPHDLSTVAYAYSSTVDRKAHQTLGLVGSMLIGARGTFSPTTGLPAGVDVVVPLLWEVFDENASPYLNESMTAAGLDVDATDFVDEGFMVRGGGVQGLGTRASWCVWVGCRV
jgi:FtsP/CotA-like multicopper oxidase with cupredoxin domain